MATAPKKAKAKTAKAKKTETTVENTEKKVSVDGAIERAEELFQTLQTRARDLLEAEEGVVATVRELVDERGLKPADVKETLDEAMGRIKSNELWDKITNSSTVAALSDYLDDLERRVEAVVERLLGTFNIATRAELEDIEKKYKSLNRKVNELNRKLKAMG